MEYHPMMIAEPTPVATPAPDKTQSRTTTPGRFRWGRNRSKVRRQAEDVQLMRAISRGDADALERLYDIYSGDVNAVAMRVLQNPEDAEDAIIDTFWEVWRRPHRYDERRATVCGYLMLVARSRAIDYRRRRDARTSAEQACARERRHGAEVMPPRDTAVWRTEQRRLMLDALRRLDSRHRRAIRMSFLDGLTHKEIADRMSRPIGTVKTWIRQGLIRLRDRLQHEI